MRSRSVIRPMYKLPARHQLLLGLLFILSSVGGWAQCPLRQPTDLTGALRTSNTYGCAPLSVSATTTHIGAVNIRYIYEYDRNRPPVTVAASEHLYKKPGEYYLVQYYEVQGNTNFSCVRVVVYDTIPPRLTLSACGLQADLAITDLLPETGRYDLFLVDWGDGQTDTVQAVQLRSRHTYTTTASRRIQVQGIHLVGACGGTSRLTFTPSQPATVQTVAPIQAGRVQVQIQNPGGLVLTLQTRTGNGAFANDQPVPGGTTSSLTLPADTLQTTCFRVVPDARCPGYSPSPEVCYTPPPVRPRPAMLTRLYLPDAFTPNNDGINDTVKPIGEAPIGSYQFVVFDRWGQIVFSTTDTALPWDGTLNGTRLPTGIYTYQLETSQSGGQIHQKIGRLQLVR